MNKLILEYNQKYIPDLSPVGEMNGWALIATPPIDEEYWCMKVRLTDKQAIVAFPKFSTYGIGFQVETDWNTNLPFQCATEDIYKHIKHNKGDKTITKKNCMLAIGMIQKVLKEMTGDYRIIE